MPEVNMLLMSSRNPRAWVLQSNDAYAHIGTQMITFLGNMSIREQEYHLKM